MMRKLIFVFLLTVGTFSNAGTVDVKYFGSVDLNDYNCQYTTSSFVHRVCYYHAQEEVVVLLGSTYYKYCGVSDKVINQWLTATSKGKFFNNKIKGRFNC